MKHFLEFFLFVDTFYVPTCFRFQIFQFEFLLVYEALFGIFPFCGHFLCANLLQISDVLSRYLVVVVDGDDKIILSSYNKIYKNYASKYYFLNNKNKFNLILIFNFIINIKDENLLIKIK